jgi:hypothetical protein
MTFTFGHKLPLRKVVEYVEESLYAKHTIGFLAPIVERHEETPTKIGFLANL